MKRKNEFEDEREVKRHKHEKIEETRIETEVEQNDSHILNMSNDIIIKISEYCNITFLLSTCRHLRNLIRTPQIRSNAIYHESKKSILFLSIHCIKKSIKNIKNINKDFFKNIEKRIRNDAFMYKYKRMIIILYHFGAEYINYLDPLHWNIQFLRDIVIHNEFISNIVNCKEPLELVKEVTNNFKTIDYEIFKDIRPFFDTEYFPFCSSSFFDNSFKSYKKFYIKYAEKEENQNIINFNYKDEEGFFRNFNFSEKVIANMIDGHDTSMYNQNEDTGLIGEIDITPMISFVQSLDKNSLQNYINSISEHDNNQFVNIPFDQKIGQIISDFNSLEQPQVQEVEGNSESDSESEDDQSGQNSQDDNEIPQEVDENTPFNIKWAYVGTTFTTDLIKWINRKYSKMQDNVFNKELDEVDNFAALRLYFIKQLNTSNRIYSNLDGIYRCFEGAYLHIFRVRNSSSSKIKNTDKLVNTKIPNYEEKLRVISSTEAGSYFFCLDNHRDFGDMIDLISPITFLRLTSDNINKEFQLEALQEIIKINNEFLCNELFNEDANSVFLMLMQISKVICVTADIKWIRSSYLSYLFITKGAGSRYFKEFETLILLVFSIFFGRRELIIYCISNLYYVNEETLKNLKDNKIKNPLITMLLNKMEKTEKPEHRKSIFIRFIELCAIEIITKCSKLFEYFGGIVKQKSIVVTLQRLNMPELSMLIADIHIFDIFKEYYVLGGRKYVLSNIDKYIFDSCSYLLASSSTLYYKQLEKFRSLYSKKMNLIVLSDIDREAFYKNNYPTIMKYILSTYFAPRRDVDKKEELVISSLCLIYTFQDFFEEPEWQIITKEIILSCVKLDEWKIILKKKAFKLVEHFRNHNK